MRLAIASVILATFCLAGGRASAVTYGKYDVTASHVHRTGVNLTAGQHVILETYNLSPTSSDTVMHLLSPSGQEVAMNDDYGGSTSSRIEYDVPSSGIYTVVVRAWNTSLAGTCSLKQNGTPIDTNFPFAGYLLAGGTTSSDTVQTALLNQGTDDTMLYGLDSGGHLLAVDDDSGVGYASKISGAFYWIMVATYGWTSGLTRAYLNDAGNDHDGDGLGGELELALCTCDSLYGYYNYSCGRYCLGSVAFPQDSDGDGIYDDWETFGIELAGQSPQHLVKWGANPARMDIFLQTNRLLGRPWITEYQINEVSKRYKGLSSIQNRDGSTGIFLHADGGFACTDGTLCGNWGYGATEIQTADYQQAWNQQATYFPSVRNGVFYWAVLGFGCGGGTTQEGWPTGIAIGNDSDCVDQTWASLAHEMGHAVGGGVLQHHGQSGNGSTNGNPTYQSLMNYAYSDTFKGDYDGYFPYLQFSPGTIYNRDVLNLDETQPVAAAGVDITFLTKAPYFFPVDLVNRRVDWNRDGTYETSVKAIFESVPSIYGIDEPQFQYQRETLPTTTTTGVQIASFIRSGSPALYLFRVDPTTGVLTYTWSLQESGGWASWTTLAAQGVVRPGVMPGTARTTMDGTDKLVVLAASANGTKLVQYILSTAGTFTGPTMVNTLATANGIKDVSAVGFNNKVYAFYRNMNSSDPTFEVHTGQCSAPLCTWGSFSPLQFYNGQIWDYVRSNVTPAPAVGPNGILYLMASEKDGSGQYRLQLFKLYQNTWLKANVTWQDAQRGHPVGFWKGRPPVDNTGASRPAMLFVNHMQGGAGMNPLPSGKGYLIAWWRFGGAIMYLLTEGALSPTEESFSMGNYRHVWSGGIGVPTSSSPSAAVFNGHAHLVKMPADENPNQPYHYPYADGLAPSYNVHKDTNDATIIQQNLCYSLKARCTGKCTTDRNTSCQYSYPLPQPLPQTDPPFIRGGS